MVCIQYVASSVHGALAPLAPFQWDENNATTIYLVVYQCHNNLIDLLYVFTAHTHTRRGFESFVHFIHCLNYCIFIFVLYIYQSLYCKVILLSKHTIIQKMFSYVEKKSRLFFQALSQEQLLLLMTFGNVLYCVIWNLDFLFFQLQEEPKIRSVISKENGSRCCHCLVAIKQTIQFYRTTYFYLSMSSNAVYAYQFYKLNDGVISTEYKV